MSFRLLSRILAAFALLALPVWSVAGQVPAGAPTAAPASREFPGDAEMIDHFQAHRAEFDEVVALYQKYGSHGNLHRGQPEYLEYTALLKRAGISHLREDGAIWLPDPYSLETARKAGVMDLFHAYAYHGITLYVENSVFSHLVGRNVWKEYFYVPVVPKVENGRLWWPLMERKNLSLHQRSARVFESLDHYPPEWLLPRKQGECVYRQIKPQWFLALCNG